MHSLGFPLRDPPFDLELVYGSRPESFPLEALADFARMGAWVVSPYDFMRPEWAAKTAVARAVRDTFKGLNFEVETDEVVEPYLESVRQAHFSLETVTFGLLRMTGVERWDESHEELSTRADSALVIAATLLQLDKHAPGGVRPSMNRAIQQASFESEFSLGVSRQTAKEIWEAYGPSSPFLLAERWLTDPEWDDATRDAMKRLMFMSPGDRDFYGLYQSFRDGGEIKRMIGTAKYLQQQLQRVLNATNATEVAFIEFPESIPTIEVAIPKFTNSELARVAEYSSRD